MKNKKAFTLAEVAIVLSILGAIAAMTLPTLLNHQKEVANRAKIKKAWTMYDRAIQLMRTDNMMLTRDAFVAWANQANCPNTIKYFQTEVVDDDNGCVFKTTDGVWFNISDILHPTITLDSNNNQTEENTFTFVVSYDSNSLTYSVNDRTFNGLTADEKADLKKLFDFIDDKKESESEEQEEETYSAEREQEKYENGDFDSFCQNWNSDSPYTCTTCKACSIKGVEDRKCYHNVSFDSFGNIIDDSESGPCTGRDDVSWYTE